ncbi:F0F1 ATP synthase subunit B' [Nitratifractor sp.]|uniref:F0F1 ATP synthase subunit B family protein n=1 Tax=Nitratifractor sp. TaxID=2268144 RepID=UPI0025E9D8ED|nr:F0F1 ATP synthase subunit B' [Nitratifractor sp.]
MLDIHVSLMLIVLAIFFFLIFQLNQRLFIPLLRFMDTRDRTIAKDLEAARNMSNDSESLQAQARENLEKARSEAARIRQEAIASVKAENQQAYEAKQRELESQYVEFTQRLEADREALKSAVLSQLPLIKESLKAKFSQI